jgi:hypothetical protein
LRVTPPSRPPSEIRVNWQGIFGLRGRPKETVGLVTPSGTARVEGEGESSQLAAGAVERAAAGSRNMRAYEGGHVRMPPFHVPSLSQIVQCSVVTLIAWTSRSLRAFRRRRCRDTRRFLLKHEVISKRSFIGIMDRNFAPVLPIRLEESPSPLLLARHQTGID